MKEDKSLYIRSRVDHFFKEFLSLTNDSGWQQCKDLRGCKVWRRRRPGFSFPTMKFEVTLPAPKGVSLETLALILEDGQMKMNMDKNIIELRLEEEDENSSILRGGYQCFYERDKLPFPLGNRDFVYVVAARSLPDKSIQIVEGSIDSNRPTRANYTRGRWECCLNLSQFGSQVIITGWASAELHAPKLPKKLEEVISMAFLNDVLKNFQTIPSYLNTNPGQVIRKRALDVIDSQDRFKQGGQDISLGLQASHGFEELSTLKDYLEDNLEESTSRKQPPTVLQSLFGVCCNVGN